MPSWRQKEEAQAPPASTTVRVRIVPASVTTPATRPASSSRPRAAQDWCTLPPRRITPRAMTGAARSGSAVPSVGEKTPPFHGLPVAQPRSAASAAESMWVTTPWVRAKSRQRVQPAISASLFER
jgi:hypothetical protein